MLTFRTVAPGQLHVVNGLPSSIYSTTNTTLTHVPTPTSGPSTSPLALYNSRLNPFEESVPLDRSMVDTVAPPADRPLMTVKRPLPPIPTVDNSQATGQCQELEAIAREITGLPFTSKSVREKVESPHETTVVRKSPQQRFRVVKPSLPTLEKAMSVALFFEQFYHALLKTPKHANEGLAGGAVAAHPGNYLLSRARRLALLERQLASPAIADEEKDRMREDWRRDETNVLRERRRKVGVQSFEIGRVIGHGAFGVVRICRELDGGRLCAMKQVCPHRTL